MDRAELEKLDREALVQRAQAAGLKRARVLTRPELIDELVRRNPQVEASQLRRSRGFFGLARDLLSRVVERGLHLPDAAERFRQVLSEPGPEVPRPEPQAIPTVTLAEIYAAQGHQQRAIETLMRVLEDEPDHVAARALLEKLQGKDYVPPREPLPPEPEYEPALLDDEDEEEEQEEDDAAVETPRVMAEQEEPAPISMSDPVTVALPASELAQLVDDRCIAIGSYVWWQLSAASQKLADHSFFFVRIVTIVSTWDGPKVSTLDVAADPHAGELVLRDFAPRDTRGGTSAVIRGGTSAPIVRIAVGFMVDGEFVPVAHSPALELGPDGASHWTLDDATPNVLGDPLVALAAERAASLSAEWH
jgi:hypothetical protein